MSFKLITDEPITESLDFLIEEKNKDAPSTVYVKGPYLMAEEYNKNKRKYRLNEMVNEVDRFTKEMIQEKRSLGELEHPTTATISAERACHLITELKQDGNYFYGKSKILSTPMGLLTRSLIMDGVKMGMSSRSLGKLVPIGDGNEVENMKLITIDCVADPSCAKAFVNGILESKQYVVTADGSFEETYDKFENSIAKLPRKDIENYLRGQILTFINNLK